MTLILATKDAEKHEEDGAGESLITSPLASRNFKKLFRIPARRRLAAMAMGLAVLAVPSLASASPITTVYSYTGSDVNWTVPDGITSLQVSLWGGGGGPSSNADGSAGVYVTGSLAVTPGEALVIGVGGGAGARTAAGGFGGGGTGWSGTPNGGAGGGYSGIFLSSVSAANALVIAGGGSGASNLVNASTPTLTAGDGTSLTGGNAATFGGVGGGGGYDGGAGGTGSTSPAGGAGSLLSNLTDSSLSAAPLGAAAVGTADPYFLSSADGAGSVAASGKNGTAGEVVISYDTSTPEPASLSLIGVGSFLLLRRRRRHVTV